MRIIGITGGIGSGKTTVSGYIRSLGYEVIDADAIARELADDERVLSEIRDLFGDDVIDPQGKLDRKHMAEIVFSNAEKKELLEAVITSRVIQECAERIQAIREGALKAQEAAAKTDKDVAFLDAPLLFETGADRLVDETWLVTCEISKRIDRAEARDAADAEDIEARIASQLPDDEKTDKADVIINNNGTLEELYKQIDDLLK